MARATATPLETETGIRRVPTGAWRVDQDHSSVAFRITLPVSTVRGRFGRFEGVIEAVHEYRSSRAHGTVAVASIDTGHTIRDHHLRSSDFFDSERYPFMGFASRQVMHIRGGYYKVVGDLTIKQTTLAVFADVTIQGGATDVWATSACGSTGGGRPAGREHGRDRDRRVGREDRGPAHLGAARRLNAVHRRSRGLTERAPVSR